MSRATLLTLCCLPLLTIPACDKGKGEGTTPPTAAGATEGDDAASAAVAQAPDPAEIAQAAQAFLLGDFAKAESLTRELWPALRDQQQQRASALAAAWFAIAATRDVVEQAEEPANYAVEVASASSDPQVKAAASLARAAVLVGMQDFSAAVAAADAAVAASPNSLEAALAHVIAAQAHIGRAFGPGDGAEIVEPAALDDAASRYADAEAVAKPLPEGAILAGHVAEGRAGVLAFQGKSSEVCPLAKAAAEAYAAAGATDWLKDGPNKLAADAGCK